MLKPGGEPQLQQLEGNADEGSDYHGVFDNVNDKTEPAFLRAAEVFERNDSKNVIERDNCCQQHNDAAEIRPGGHELLRQRQTDDNEVAAVERLNNNAAALRSSLRPLDYLHADKPFCQHSEQRKAQELYIERGCKVGYIYIIKDHDRYKIPEDHSVKAENILALYIAQSARHVAESDDNEYRSNCVQAYDKVFQSVPSASEDSR